jgi:threonine synthase
VPKALGDFLILSGVYSTGGAAIAATDEEMMNACQEIARLEGIFAAPEGGAGLVAVQQLIKDRKVRPDESVVVFNTGSGYKYSEAWNAVIPV